MISFHCDRCDRIIEVADDMAGARIECPDCGDMNIVPGLSEPGPGVSRPAAGEIGGDTARRAAAVGGAGIASRSAAAAAAAPIASRVSSHRDEALESAGLPPASGPEQTIKTVHPAMFRAIPALFILLCLFVVGGLIGSAVFALRSGSKDTNTLYTVLFLVLVAIGAIWLFIWWVKCHHVTLKITNKRTILDLGLLSKNTSEVSHDNIRNFQVRQTFLGRLLNIGSIGISSSGQDEIEININHIARPMELRRIIDTYRHD